MKRVNVNLMEVTKCTQMKNTDYVWHGIYFQNWGFSCCVLIKVITTSLMDFKTIHKNSSVLFLISGAVEMLSPIRTYIDYILSLYHWSFLLLMAISNHLLICTDEFNLIHKLSLLPMASFK